VSWWQGLSVVLMVVAAMEVVAYVAHRWVMHGFLWVLHKSHHDPRRGMFERNDWFGVFGAVVSIALFYWGVQAGGGPLVVWIACGITGYGAIYFGFHDIIVHRRLKHHWVPKSRYMKRIVQAHRLHHVIETKHGTVSFGFIYAPPVRDLLADLEARGVGRIRASSKVRAEMDREMPSAVNG
jgi:beta-carotene 3-hydroxylase